MYQLGTAEGVGGRSPQEPTPERVAPAPHQAGFPLGGAVQTTGEAGTPIHLMCFGCISGMSGRFWSFPNLPHPRRHAPGDWPLQRLNARENARDSENPSIQPTSARPSLGSTSQARACSYWTASTTARNVEPSSARRRCKERSLMASAFATSPSAGTPPAPSPERTASRIGERPSTFARCNVASTRTA